MGPSYLLITRSGKRLTRGTPGISHKAYIYTETRFFEIHSDILVEKVSKVTREVPENALPFINEMKFCKTNVNIPVFFQRLEILSNSEL